MKRCYLISTLAALVTVGLYLLWAGLSTPPGFPLDDGWIHQVFARNLAQRGEFSYNPGQLVAGSTSPLWTILLVPGYLFGGEGYKWWAYLLGLLFLVLTAGEVARLYQILFPQNSKEKSGNWPPYLVAALFTVFEWRLVWAAASGMETMLFTFGTLWLIRFYLEISHKSEVRSQKSEGIEPEEISRAKSAPAESSSSLIPHPSSFKASLPFLIPYPSSFIPSYALLGFGGGLLALVRPEGMVLLGLIGLDIGRRFLFAGTGSPRRKIGWLTARWGAIIALWLVPVLPYLLFNYAASGSPLPTTFYAKNSGYAGDRSFLEFLGYFPAALTELILRGPLLFLLPGLLPGIYRCFGAGRVVGAWRPLVWPPVLLLLYAIQLPVTYQHGRYLMPLIPLLVVYGIYGTTEIMGWLKTQKLPAMARLLPLVVALPTVIVWFTQAQAYQFDVKFINDEQVRIGKWLHDNTPSDAVVASHDIGAIGYFSGRKLVDTAGLVSPEFIPIVQNHPAILKKLQEKGVNYFALFSDWYGDLYQQLSAEGRKVFQPDETYLAQFDKENMAVFKLK